MRGNHFAILYTEPTCMLHKTIILSHHRKRHIFYIYCILLDAQLWLIICFFVSWVQFRMDDGKNRRDVTKWYPAESVDAFVQTAGSQGTIPFYIDWTDGEWCAFFHFMLIIHTFVFASYECDSESVRQCISYCLSVRLKTFRMQSTHTNLSLWYDNFSQALIGIS